MKLDKTLNFKKVRCVKGYDDCLEIGKEYEVIDISVEIKVKDDEGKFLYWESDHFEPVLDSAENPLQGAELTPEFEAVEPKFKVGDKVYWGLNSRIFKVYRLVTTNVLQVELDDCVEDAHKDELCLATQENYGKLCSLFERIDFEQPLKELKGSDLCRAMLDKGWVSVPCYISDESDYEADNNAFCALIGKFDRCFKELATNYEHEYAVPFDPRTGEPLTEAVLDE